MRYSYYMNLRTLMGQVVRATMPVYYSFDMRIMRTMMGGIVCATEQTHRYARLVWVSSYTIAWTRVQTFPLCYSTKTYINLDMKAKLKIPVWPFNIFLPFSVHINCDPLWEKRPLGIKFHFLMNAQECRTLTATCMHSYSMAHCVYYCACSISGVLNYIPYTWTGYW